MKDILSLWIEDKIQKTIWYLYIFLSPALPILFETVFFQQNSKHGNMSLRILLLESFLLNIATLASFLRYAIQKKPLKRQAKKISDISPLAFQILSQFGVEGNVAIPADAFVKSFDVSFQNAQHAIDELLELNLLSLQAESNEFFYYIKSDGRKFLKNNGAL